MYRLVYFIPIILYWAILFSIVSEAKTKQKKTKTLIIGIVIFVFYMLLLYLVLNNLLVRKIFLYLFAIDGIIFFIVFLGGNLTGFNKKIQGEFADIFQYWFWITAIFAPLFLTAVFSNAIKK